MTVGSLLEELAQREAVARQRIAEIREQIAALESRLEDEHDRLSRLLITRETVEEILGKAAEWSVSPWKRPKSQAGASTRLARFRYGRRYWVW